MKKLSLLLITLIALNSCGTICGGRITDCQRTKPKDGTHRQIRPAALIFDCLPTFTGIGAIFTGIYLAVDFGNGAMYKPCK